MEAEFHRWLSEHVPAHPRLPLGLSDDAALWSLGSQELLVTTDLLSDGVDFRLPCDDLRRIGRKSLAVSLSDLAAMAAAPPLAALVSIALPKAGVSRHTPLDMAIMIYEGLLALSDEFSIAIAGGDTNTHDGPLVINVTAFGLAAQRGPLKRSGGHPGDRLLVTGSLGGSSLGHHFDFVPRIREAQLLHERYELAAGMDISDGLALDASRLAAASGCGALIYIDELPVSDAAAQLTLLEFEMEARSTSTAIEHALSDGEDFELLLAAPPHVAEAILDQQPLACPITCIGELISERGLWQRGADGMRHSLEPMGWEH